MSTIPATSPYAIIQCFRTNKWEWLFGEQLRIIHPLLEKAYRCHIHWAYNEGNCSLPHREHTVASVYRAAERWFAFPAISNSNDISNRQLGRSIANRTVTNDVSALPTSPRKEDIKTKFLLCFSLSSRERCRTRTTIDEQRQLLL